MNKRIRNQSSLMTLKTHDKQRGFTLLEILIALFIFTIIAMLATGVLHTVIKAYEGSQTKANRLIELQTALLLLSHDVPLAVDRPITNAIGKEEAAFIGTPKGFTFTQFSLVNANSLLSSKNNPLERKGVYWYKEKLWRVSMPALDQPPKMKVKSSILLHDVNFASFGYLDSQGKIHDAWPIDTDPQHPLPKAIQIEMKLTKWGTLSQTFVLMADALKPVVTAGETEDDKNKGKEQDENKDKGPHQSNNDKDDGVKHGKHQDDDDDEQEDIEDD